MTIFVFGNPDIQEDSLPLKILPKLEKRFPKINFKVKDPNEEWDVREELIIIDTIIGIRDAQTFDDLKEFINSPRFSLHDFDALTNLHYLQKLGKLKKIKIIGISPTLSREKALKKVSAILRSIQL